MCSVNAASGMTFVEMDPVSTLSRQVRDDDND